MVKNLVLLAAMSATASAGEHDLYCSHLTKQFKFKCDKCTHILIDSVFFFGVTTIGLHQSVGSVTGVIMYCCCRESSSAANLSRCAYGMDLGDVTQNGLALVVR